VVARHRAQGEDRLVEVCSSEDADVLAAIKWAVDNNLSDVISQSFGQSKQCVDPKILRQQHAVFQEAINRGISPFASSRDDGVVQENCAGSDDSSFRGRL